MCSEKQRIMQHFLKTNLPFKKVKQAVFYSIQKLLTKDITKCCQIKNIQL